MQNIEYFCSKEIIHFQKNAFIDSTDDPFGIPREPDRGVSEGSVLLFGYYQVPKHTSIKLTPAIGSLQLVGKHPSKTFEHGKYIEKITPEPLFPPPRTELLEYDKGSDKMSCEKNCFTVDFI